VPRWNPKVAEHDFEQDGDPVPNLLVRVRNRLIEKVECRTVERVCAPRELGNHLLQELELLGLREGRAVLFGRNL
jgi:hypothetical protein